MSCELNLTFMDPEEFDEYRNSLRSSTAITEKSFQPAIFSPSVYSYPSERTTQLKRASLQNNCKIQRILQANRISPMGTIKAEAGVSYEWGGKDSGISGHVSGSASDNKGNKAEVEVKVNNDGSGSVNVSVSHDEKTNKQ